jgi:kynurenine formamidase
MRYEYLSHKLTDETPVFGAKTYIGINVVKSIENGDSANTYKFSMENHWGTHVDAPNHFFEKGLKIADYPPEFWFFKSPQFIQIALQPSEILNCGKWIESINPNTDLLLFQSGWSELRGQELYVVENPGIHPEVGLYMRKCYPNLRAVGINWVSISPYQNRTLGREAHRAFLNPEGENNPILIIEDMDLSCDLEKLKEVMVFPVYMETIDSAPCTAIGVFND